MAKVKIQVAEVVGDIRRGMDKSRIMEKYKLSAAVVQTILEKLVSSGLIDPAVLNQPLPSPKPSNQPALSAQQSPGEEAQRTTASPEIRKAAIRIDAKQVVTDILAGLNDSELMEKYKLSVTQLQSLFKKLLAVGIVTESTLARRVHWSERVVDLERYECPACHMPQLFRFEECPQCGVIVAKYPKSKLKKRAFRPKHWMVEMGSVKFRLATNGKGMVIEGLSPKDQKKAVEIVSNLLSLRKKEQDERDAVAGSHFWVQAGLGVGERQKVSTSKDDRKWYIEIGRFTIKPTVDGTGLQLDGLDERIQKEVLSSVQSMLTP